MGGVFRTVTGELAAEWGVLGAIADVDRRLRGRWTVGFVRFGDEAEATAFEAVGGERGYSALDVALPFLCADGGFGLFGDDDVDSF